MNMFYNLYDFIIIVLIIGNRCKHHDLSSLSISYSISYFVLPFLYPPNLLWWYSSTSKYYFYL